MNTQVAFYLDGNLVVSPSNWQDLESVVANDPELGGVLVYEESNLTFIEDGYDYLNTVSSTGFCNVVDLVIKASKSGILQEIIGAKIFVSDITFNERECTATVKIQDKSFFAMLNNNRNAKFSPGTTLTKNQQTMTAASVYNLDVFSQANVIYRNNVPAYRVFDAMQALITYISDGRVAFASTLFDVGGEFEGLCISTGYNVRTGLAGEFTPFNLEDFLKELNSLMPVAFQVEQPYTSPIFRLEKRSYFQQSGVTLTVDNIYEIKRRYDRQRLYTNLQIGSSVTDADVTLNFPETIKFLGYNEENYNLLGECNINTTLDLVGDWVRSNNIIQRIITGDQGYDDQIIWFDSTLIDATNGRTTNTNFLNLSPAIFFYNERLTNTQIADRYESWIPNSFAQNFGSIGDGLFIAYNNAAVAVAAGTFLDISFDTTNVWANPGGYFNGTDRFTATQSGVYDIETNLVFGSIVITPPPSNPAVWALGSSIRQFDSAGNLIRTVTMNNPSYGNNATTKTLNNTRRFVMNAGDYLLWQVTKTEGIGTDVTGSFTTGTYWKCVRNTVGGGVFKEYTPDDYPVNLYDFEVPLTCDEWQTIIAGPNGLIQFRSSGDFRSAYLRQIKYNHIRGTAQFTLIRNSNAD